jgi:hypothetical protein
VYLRTTRSRCLRPRTSVRSRHSVRIFRTHRSANALARGCGVKKLDSWLLCSGGSDLASGDLKGAKTPTRTLTRASVPTAAVPSWIALAVLRRLTGGLGDRGDRVKDIEIMVLRHQLETPTPIPRPIAAPSIARIRRRDVLGGLIHEYWADAA